MNSNVNLTAISVGSTLIGSVDREIAVERQVFIWTDTPPRCSVDREIAVERQGQDVAVEVESGSVDRGVADDLVVRRYTFKLYPTKLQEEALVKQASLLATLWNAALEQREIQWSHECQRRPRGERKGLSKYDQQRELKQVRSDDPEYAAIGQDTESLCLTALDDAFRAFFRRAKAGAGASSGYPRYKSPYAIENKGADCTIWHRDHRKGWRLDRAGKHFKVYAKGIPGTIKARGKFPVDLDGLTLRDMRLIRVGGVWQCSIVVKLAARMKPGSEPARVEFDLIDKFARVSLANGECLPGWEGDFQSPNERIYPEYHDVNQQPAVDALESGANDRHFFHMARIVSAVDALESGAGDRWAALSRGGARAVDALESGSDDRDSIQSERDLRFKKFSCRWRREKRRIAKMQAREARQRRDALHRWTTKLISSVSELTVVSPPIKESTRSARGTETNHGAAVRTVAKLNRHILAQAPALAIQMLEYKAAEAGIPFARVTPDEHQIAIGRDLSEATKAARRASRINRKEAA